MLRLLSERGWWASLVVLLHGVALLQSLVFANKAGAQPAISELPRAEYYLARELLGAGRTTDAAAGFEAALGKARKIGQERWVDSIPPLVMLGECHYQMGSLAAAMEHYDAALMLAIAHEGWLDQMYAGVEQLAPLDSPTKGIDWFRKTSPTVPVAIPGAVQISLDPTQTQIGPNGELIAPVNLITRLDAMEVLRTLGIAVTRRWQVLGPLCKHSPLTQPLQQMFSRQPQQPAPWVQASWSMLHGISDLTNPTAKDAADRIRQGAVLEDRFDYFMSPLAWQVSAELAIEEGNYNVAFPWLQDACLVAAQYEQHDALAAAFQQLSSAACATQRFDLIEPLRLGATWCAKRSTLAQLSALIGVSELVVLADNPALADQLLKQSWSALQQREVELPRLNAQASYVGALLGFLQQRPAVGQGALDTALTLMRGTAQTGAVARPVFQAQMALDLLASKGLTERQVEEVLDVVLREPTPSQWANHPLEVLATITTASQPAFDRWFDLALSRKAAPDEVLAKMDRLQRQHLYEKLPLGGRLFSWRLAANADVPTLPPEVRQPVTQGWQRTPKLQSLPVDIQRLSAVLANGPVPVDERQLSTDIKKAFGQLQNASAELENIVRFHSLGRNALPRHELPAANLPAVQGALQQDECALAFLVYRSSLLGIAITSQSVEIWQVDPWEVTSKKLSMLLGSIGLLKPTGHSPSAVLAANAPWKATAFELRDLLISANVQATIANSQRLIVVPSGSLWYLPFELLPEAGMGSDPWITSHPIVYLPTLGSINLANSPRPVINHTVGIAGNFFSADRDVNSQQANLLASKFQNSHVIPISQKITVPHSAWLSLTTERMWIAVNSDPVPVSWTSIVLPLGKPKEMSLRDILEAPAIAPQHLLLPGWRTTAEAPGGLGNGDELFLPAVTLLTSGVRSALLSRWAVGGLSTERLLERCMLEYENETATEAYRRSVVALWNEEFLTSDEPILMPAGKEATTLTSGRHPLLWSSYLTIGDTLEK